MDDYISREAVEQIIAAQCGECADACLEFDGIQPDCNQCLLYGAKKAIESIPAADVRPVRRGKWIVYPECLKYINAYSVDHIVCSACEECFSMLDNDCERFNFCPNCGADMRPEPPKDLIGTDMRGGIRRDDVGNVIDWGITGPPGDVGKTEEE